MRDWGTLARRKRKRLVEIRTVRIAKVERDKRFSSGTFCFLTDTNVRSTERRQQHKPESTQQAGKTMDKWGNGMGWSE